MPSYKVLVKLSYEPANRSLDWKTFQPGEVIDTQTVATVLPIPEMIKQGWIEKTI